MPRPFVFFLLLLTDAGLGLLFYGGLWLTVRALPASRHPVALMLLSFWGRTGLTLAGLILAMDGSWQKAVVSMAGFLLARVMLSPWIPGDGPAGKSAV